MLSRTSNFCNTCRQCIDIQLHLSIVALDGAITLKILLVAIGALSTIECGID